MARKRQPTSPYLDQATLAALVRYGPELRGLRALLTSAQGDYTNALGQAAGQRQATVGAIMTAPVRVLDAQAPVALLLPLLSEGGVSAVPILQDDRLAGIVTRSDLVALLAHELALGQGA